MSERTDMHIFDLEWTGDRAPFAKAFVAAQKATESVKKAATNPAFKTKYADLAHVVEGVIPALNAAGVGVMQFPAFDGEFVGVTTELLHESGASVRSTLKMRPSKTDPQGVGSAITYARRYALLAMTGAAPEDDDGQAASGPRTQEPRPEPKRQETKAPTLTERADRLAVTLRSVTTYADLKRAWDLGKSLREELDVQDQKAGLDLADLYEERKAELETANQKVAA